MPREIILNVNGQIHRMSVDPDTPLVYVLRNDLGLKGTKFACGLEQCGACKIIIDGQAVPSCQIPVKSVEGREITTIEGIGTVDNLHPLQKVFIEEQAVQCGFCTSGMIITAKALLDRNPGATDDEIRAEMSGNLCRCGAYDRIFKAIKRAAGQPIPNPSYSVAGGRDRLSPPEFRVPSADTFISQYLQQTPDLDSWVRINTDMTITLFTGKAELGQDLRTSIAMIGADELDVSLDRIRVVTADTDQSPDEGYTVSSMSLETSGNAVRYAAAEVRRIALLAAHEELGAPVERLTVTDGTIIDSATGRSVTYWDLFAGKPFHGPVMGGGQPKGPEAYRIVGRPAARLDLLAKVTGGHCFVQDLDMPGMVHGRVVRPPHVDARLVSMDEEAVNRLPGIIQVVRDGSFLAVIAEREEQAVQAMAVLRNVSVWENHKTLPAQEDLFDRMLNQEDQAHLIKDGGIVPGAIPPIETPEGAAHTLVATFCRPYHMHASLGPSAAVAQMIDGKLTVWTHSQGVYPLRAALAQVLGIGEDDIHAVHVEGPGCYGHNGADDAALDAALLARALPGRPVSLKWSRTDENTWEPYGPATVVKMQASLSTDGDVIDWNHDVWGYAHGARPHGREGGMSNLLAAWHLAEPLMRPQPRPLMIPHGCVHRNADPLYTFPRRRIVMHFLPDSALRVSSLRGLGSYANVFAIESFIDELAHASGADPIEFRLRYLADQRARDVIEAVVKKAGRRPDGLGRGFAFARYKNRQSYVGVVVDLGVDRESGIIHLVRAVAAVDAGQIVNPDALSNQIEGVITQAASCTLKEQVSFDRTCITSIDWQSYLILRFPEAPTIETVLVNRPGRPYLGVGEGAGGPVPAAIANAVFNATGIRLRRIPFTPERVKKALS
jgi:nicotinate dehydrogenase subunit B